MRNFFNVSRKAVAGWYVEHTQWECVLTDDGIVWGRPEGKNHWEQQGDAIPQLEQNPNDEEPYDE